MYSKGSQGYFYEKYFQVFSAETSAILAIPGMTVGMSRSLFVPTGFLVRSDRLKKAKTKETTHWDLVKGVKITVLRDVIFRTLTTDRLIEGGHLMQIKILRSGVN